MLHVTLLEHTPDPERLIAAAAKLCYSPADADTILEGLTPEKTEKFLAMLTEMGHESPVSTPFIPLPWRASPGACWRRSPGTASPPTASSPSGMLRSRRAPLPL